MSREPRTPRRAKPARVRFWRKVLFELLRDCRRAFHPSHLLAIPGIVGILWMGWYIAIQGPKIHSRWVPSPSGESEAILSSSRDNRWGRWFILVVRPTGRSLEGSGLELGACGRTKVDLRWLSENELAVACPQPIIEEARVPGWDGTATMDVQGRRLVIRLQPFE